MQITSNVILTIILFFSLTTIHASDEQHSHDKHLQHNESMEESMFKEHSAHEHGHASSQVTFIDNTLNLELSLPSIDIFGFEYEPHNETEHQNIIESKAILGNARNIISIYPNNI